FPPPPFFFFYFYFFTKAYFILVSFLREYDILQREQSLKLPEQLYSIKIKVSILTTFLDDLDINASFL
ncbi:hypothetical protein, partial [Streptococcus himalayensis]|uniref:hypothetical protein n=1 Tax=Streptococcus himalayensis TaxID=1888195 RepID=UPI001E2ED276